MAKISVTELDNKLEANIFPFYRENKDHFKKSDLHSPVIYSHNTFFESKQNLLAENNLYMILFAFCSKIYLIGYGFVTGCNVIYEALSSDGNLKQNLQFSILIGKKIHIVNIIGRNEREEALKSTFMEIFLEPDKYEIPSIGKLFDNICNTSDTYQWLFFIKLPRVDV